MPSKTERWRAAVRPGSPAPPDKFIPSTPPPMVTPDCSISNVGVTCRPTTRGRSSSTSSPMRSYQHYPRHTPPPPPPPPLPNYFSPSRTPPYSTRPRGPTRAATYNEFYTAEARAQRPVRPSPSHTCPVYVIQGPRGSNIQVLSPQRSGSVPIRYTSHRSYSPATEKSLFRRVLDKLSNKDKNDYHNRTRSSTAFPSTKYPVEPHSNRSRRNSTGSSNKWHVIPGEPKYTSRGGRIYNII